MQVLSKQDSVQPVVVQLLCKVWEQVYRGIQTISASAFPTSNLCLAELLKLREILHSQLARFSGDDVDVEDLYNILDFNRKANRKVVDVLRGASGTLDKAIQDSYLVWSVPLTLDPGTNSGTLNSASKEHLVQKQQNTSLR